MQLQFKTLQLVDSVSHRILLHIPSSKVNGQEGDKVINYTVGPILIPNRYFSIQFHSMGVLGSIYLPSVKRK